jgi:hypothetical protein
MRANRFVPGGLSRHTGKSSLAVRYVDGHFVESYYPTIENTFSKEIHYKGQAFSTEIVDTAGQVCSLYSLSLWLSNLEMHYKPRSYTRTNANHLVSNTTVA